MEAEPAYGYPDRTRTIAHRLIDTAPLRATLPTPLPRLRPEERTALALLARHDLKATARIMDVSEGTVKMLSRRTRTLLGARNRTHAVVIALLAGITAPPAATASEAAVDFGLAP